MEVRTTGLILTSTSQSVQVYVLDRGLTIYFAGEKKDFEVYSCHVSPDGTRLVTAAGGELGISECNLCMERGLSLLLQDGYVRIWSTEAIYRAADTSFNKPRQLASMSYHSGTIHTVRFSPTGRYVASGADDKIVCIYILDPNPPSHSSTFGTLPCSGTQV